MNAPKQQSNHYDHFDISLAEMISRILENRWMVIIFFVFSFLIASFLVYRQVDLYESQLLLQVDSPHMGGQDMLAQLSGAGYSSDPVMSQIFLIQSRFILEPVIEKMGLNIDSKYVPQSWWERLLRKNHYHLDVSEFNIPKKYFKQKFIVKVDKPGHIQLFDHQGHLLLAGQEKTNLQADSGLFSLNIDNVSAPVGSEFVLSKKTSLSMVGPLSESLKINQLGFTGTKGTGILQLTLRGAHIAETIKILNTIAETIEQKDIQKRSEEASKTLVFLNKQLPITKGQLEEAESKLNNYRAKSGKLDIKTQSQMLLQKMVALDSHLESLELKHMDMSQKYTTEHPIFKRLLAQIAKIRTQKEEVENQLRHQPSMEQVAINLMRDVSVKKMLYMVFLKKIQELEVIQAGTLSGVHVLTKASVPEMPIAGKGRLYMISAALFATFLSIVFVILKTILYPRIDDPQWVEKNYQLPNLAIIPYSQEQLSSNQLNKQSQLKSLMLLSESHPRNLTVEALRSLRTNMQVNLATSHNNIIGILGIAPGVGKSFISVNIAYLMAVTGKRVLLIDADLRKGTIHRYLNLKPSLGLADILNEKIKLEDGIKRNIYPNLDVIVRGDYPHDPSELLMKNNFQKLIQEVSADYDIVIFDTAPVLLVTDALIVGGFSANNYLILGAGVHEPHDIEIVMNRLNSVGVELKGSIFNFHRAHSIVQGGYGKYSKYAYYRGYRAYYADEKA